MRRGYIVCIVGCFLLWMVLFECFSTGDHESAAFCFRCEVIFVCSAACTCVDLHDMCVCVYDGL